MGWGMPEGMENAIKQGDIETIRRCLQERRLSSCYNQYGQSPLVLAVVSGRTDVMDLLIGLGADTDEGHDGSSLVDLALWNQKPEVLFYLLEHGDSTTRFERAADMMRTAAAYGDAAVVDRLLEEGVDVNAADKQGRTALICAAIGYGYGYPHEDEDRRVGNRIVVRRLLSHGADITLRSHGETALREAARSNDREMVRLLREAGARIELTEAAMIGDTDTLSALLDHGEYPDQRDVDGNTALMHAAERGFTETVRLLLTRGADPVLVSPYGQTAFWMACAGGHIETAEAIIKCVSGHEAATLARNNLSQNRLAKILVGNGVDVNACNPECDLSPLMEAATLTDPLLVRLLLEAGAEIDRQNEYGYTALMCAVQHRQVEPIQLLLQSGATVDVDNVAGVSILREIQGLGHAEIEAILRAAGATDE